MNGRGRPVCLNCRDEHRSAWRSLNRIAGRFVESAGDPVRRAVRHEPPSLPRPLARRSRGVGLDLKSLYIAETVTPRKKSPRYSAPVGL
jgi:hypothetical protein